MKHSEDKDLLHSIYVEKDEIDLRELWNILRRHQRSIILITFISMLLATLIVFSMKPIYRSTATLLIETEERNVVSIEGVYSGGQQSIKYLNTQFEVIKSEALARKVIDELKLTKHPYFLPKVDEYGNEVSQRSSLMKLLPEAVSAWFEPAPGISIDGGEEFTPQELRIRKLLGRFYEMMSVLPVRNTQLIEISFEANNNYLAAQMANGMAQMYINDQLDARLEMTAQANSWLSERLLDIRGKLKTSEEALQNYREQEQLIDTKGVTGLISKQLEELNQDLITAQRTLNSLESARKQIEQIKGDKYQDYLSVPAVLNDDLASQLIADASVADRTLESLGQRYGHKHPKIISAKAALNTANKALKNHVHSVVNGIDRQYQLARSAETSAQEALRSAKEEMRDINRKEHQLGILQREVNANRQLYDLFLKRIKETAESTDINQTNARIVDHAIPAINPVKPKKMLIILAVGFVSLIFSITLSFLFEHFDNTVKSAHDIEARFKIAVLGVLPKIQGKMSDLWKIVKIDTRASYSEGIRTIQTGVVLSRLDNPHKTIMVTSSLPGEGKTMIAANTAINLSEMYKVLLIDADMRKPSVGSYFGLEPEAKGLTELLAKLEKSSSCIHRWESTNLYVMPLGRVPPNPLELISSRAFKRLLEKLTTLFDHIIIDSAPVLPVSDSRLIATMVSGVIYVIKADSTPVSVIRDGLHRLNQANIHIIGGVLNQFDTRKHQQYGNYDYSGGYYTESYGDNS
jgi:capsular exopolysaccharide synthesis family protein